MYQLTLFDFFAVATLALALVARRHELDVLLFGLDHRKRHLPDPKLQRQRDAEDASERARRLLAWTAFAWCVFMSGVHAYDRVRQTCLADRKAARLHPPPFHCGAGSTPWAELGWVQAATFTLYPNAADQSCAEYLLRTHDACIPNPLVVLVDTFLVAPLHAVDRVSDSVAHALQSFLDHFSWPVKIVLILVVACAVTLLLALRMYLPTIQRFAHVVRREYAALPAAPRPSTVRVEELVERNWGSVQDDGCMLQLKEL